MKNVKFQMTNDPVATARGFVTAGCNEALDFDLALAILCSA